LDLCTEFVEPGVSARARKTLKPLAAFTRAHAQVHVTLIARTHAHANEQGIPCEREGGVNGRRRPADDESGYRKVAAAVIVFRTQKYKPRRTGPLRARVRSITCAVNQRLLLFLSFLRVYLYTYKYNIIISCARMTETER